MYCRNAPRPSSERVRCSALRTLSSSLAMAGGSEMVMVSVVRMEIALIFSRPRCGPKNVVCTWKPAVFRVIWTHGGHRSEQLAAGLRDVAEDCRRSGRATGSFAGGAEQIPEPAARTAGGATQPQERAVVERAAGAVRSGLAGAERGTGILCR